MNLWMDTAQTRWTVRHKQHIGQEACEAAADFNPLGTVFTGSLGFVDDDFLHKFWKERLGESYRLC